MHFGCLKLVDIAALCMNYCGHCHCANEVSPTGDLPTQIETKLEIGAILDPLQFQYRP